MKKVVSLLILGLAITLVSGCLNNPETEPEHIPTQVPEAQRADIGISSNSCGDGICGRTETYASCPSECVSTCGNGAIDDTENWKNCRHDLLKDCGNSICDEWEHYRYCSEDCEECIVDDRGTYTGPNKCPPSPRWVV